MGLEAPTTQWRALGRRCTFLAETSGNGRPSTPSGQCRFEGGRSQRVHVRDCMASSSVKNVNRSFDGLCGKVRQLGIFGQGSLDFPE